MAREFPETGEPFSHREALLAAGRLATKDRRLKLVVYWEYLLCELKAGRLAPETFDARVGRACREARGSRGGREVSQKTTNQCEPDASALRRRVRGNAAREKKPYAAAAHLVSSRRPAVAPPNDHKCTATNKAGKPCSAPRVGGTKFCTFHGDPEHAQVLRSRGGSRRAIFDPDKLKKFEPPRTVEDVIAVVGQLSVEVHQCMVDPKAASCIGGLLHTLVDAIEIEEQGKLLRELERRAGLQDPAARLHDEATGRFLKFPDFGEGARA